MPTFIKTGFWTKVAKASDGALNLNRVVEEASPAAYDKYSVPYLADLPNITTAQEISWPAGGNSSYGACLSSINGCIYTAPYGGKVVKVDPVAKTATAIGATVGGSYKGIVQAGNGMLYCVPDQATTILKIDPTTDTVSTFGSIAGSNKYNGGVLAPNGKIYCIPWSATVVLVIDPATDTVATFGSLGGNFKWSGGVLGRNGIIYGFPYNNASILIINPATNSASTRGFNTTVGAYRTDGGILHPTKSEIIACPAEYRSMYIYNYSEGAAYFTPEILPNFSYKHRGSVLAPDRKTMISTPNTVREILLFDVDTFHISYKDYKTGLDVKIPKSGGNYNSFCGTVLAKDGNIYMVPASSGASHLLTISGFSGYTDSMTTLPTNLATDLATSDYNLFQNKF